MPSEYVPPDSSGRKSALLLLINFAILGALFAAWYYGVIERIWLADQLKLSFVVIALYLLTAFASIFSWIGDELVETVEARLPMIALVGTTYGILTVFSVLAEAKFNGAADFKSLIGPLLSGGGSAMWPTFLALLGSNLLWLHLLIKRGA